MNSIVLVNNSFFPRLFEIAVFLKNNNYKPIIFFDTNYPTINRDINLCKNANINFELLYSVIQKREVENDIIIRNLDGGKAIFKKIKAYLIFKTNWLYTMTLIPGIINHYRTKYNFTKVCKKHMVVMIILPYDLPQYNTSLYIQIIHKLGHKALLLPSYMNTYKEMATHYFSDPAHNCSGISGKIIKFLFKKWTLTFNGKTLLRIPIEDILLKEMFSLASRDPWIANSGNVDALGVEGIIIKEQCVIQGIKPDKIFVTGSLSNDIQFDSIKKIEINKKEAFIANGIIQTKPILLSAIPPDMFNSRKQFTEFDNYKDFLNYWLITLCKQSYFDVIISLHHSVDIKDYLYLEEYGCTITDKPLSLYMTFCDLFVSSSFSATIQWAIACGKPVIHHDTYKYQFDNYNGLDGIVTVESNDDFEKELTKCTQSDYFEFLKFKQYKVTSGWGMLDGQAGTRILGLINQLHN